METMLKRCPNLSIGISNESDRNDKFSNEHSKSSKYSSANVKECLTKYSLDDKVEAIKRMLDYNEKKKDTSPRTSLPISVKKTVGVKECLQEEQKKSAFQTAISELRNTVTNSYWHKEVGKTRYQVANLPIGMNPIETTFGKTFKSDGSVAELINPKEIQGDKDDSIIRQMYRKSHNNYEPSEQIYRNYEVPFDKYSRFGKTCGVNYGSKGVKKLLTWINSDPNTVVNFIQADFMKRTQPRVGEIKNIENSKVHMNKVHGKRTKTEEFGAAKCLSDCFTNEETTFQQKSLEHLNTLRQRLKKRVPEILFLDIFEDLLVLDKEYKDILSEEEVFGVLSKYKIHVNKSLFLPLLDVLQIREKGNINYKTLLNLLNWKFDFPTLPKLKKMECQNYNTTYNETIANVNQRGTKDVAIAGIPSVRWEFKFLCDKENLGERSSAYHLIFPSIFTKHGISSADMLKIKSKEEIKSIFENIGITFPGNSFNLIWQEGLQKDGTDGVCVQTFNSLLSERNFIIDQNK